MHRRHGSREEDGYFLPGGRQRMSRHLSDYNPSAQYPFDVSCESPSVTVQQTDPTEPVR